MKNLRVVVITGMSGSGKSVALRALEDIGFFCVDNLPVVLLPKFLEIRSRAQDIPDVALVMDLRERGFLEKYGRVFTRLRERGYKIEILFLDAGDETLIHRYSETRRAHPLSVKGSVTEGINLEREKLLPLKRMADRVIDTTSCNVHQLKETVQRSFLSAGAEKKRLVINVMSFGYRFGVPADADLVMDVRFLPNPYFVEHLKQHDGHNPDVRDYVTASKEGTVFLRKIFDLMAFLLPLYEKEGKARLNVALGCTGGKHRSVVMANQLGAYFSDRDYLVNIAHRDIGKA